jgi:predicted lipoprotein with Yx(FWY)xxD motif
VAVAVAGQSSVGHPRPTLRTASNGAVGRTIVVDAQGRTLYRLSPETARHLLCTASCLRSWVPVPVASGRTKARAGAHIQGRVGALRRPGGLRQVTLRGHPLYRFRADRKRGQARGTGIQSFGGTWQVVLPRESRLPPTPPPAPPGPVPGPKLPPIPPPA